MNFWNKLNVKRTSKEWEAWRWVTTAPTGVQSSTLWEQYFSRSCDIWAQYFAEILCPGTGFLVTF